MKLFPVNTGFLSIPYPDLYKTGTDSVITIPCPADKENRVVCSVRSLLICSDKFNLLIDTGVGTLIDPAVLDHYSYRSEGEWDALLSPFELAPEDIDEVILTHLHFDHCGGCIQSQDKSAPYNSLTINFPNANHYVSTVQWEWAQNTAEREKDSFFEHTFLPIRQHGRLKLIDKESVILPGIHVRFFNGHTKGLMLPVITCGKRTIAFAGDLIPTLAHLRTDIVMSYDIDPLLIMEEKRIFLAEGKKRDWMLFLQHDHHSVFEKRF
jgi:glyoxylase-like metal-dependent hydrolase (beta-lactamase superfamily II)